ARYQQARRDIEPGVVGLPLEEWSPSLAAAARAVPHAIPVRFVEKPFPGLSGLEKVAVVRAGGRDARGLVFAGDTGLAVASAREGYRLTTLSAPGTRDVVVADVTNSGELDLVTPSGLWVAGREPRKGLPGGQRSEALAKEGERVLALDYDSDG